MRRAHKVWVGIAAATFALVAIGDLSGSHGAPTVASEPVASAGSGGYAPAVPSYVPAPTYAPVPSYAPPTAAPAPSADGQTATVTEVIDGDTFVADGQKVRVLGIDSCEAATAGGQEATQTARSLLSGQQVTLRAEPGVDHDRYGRELRYVALASGTDFGETMVAYDHTAVYQGHNDASPAYVAALRAADPNGRSCAGPAAPSPAPDYSDGGGTSVHHHHDHGLPDGALTGGFCRRHWWC